MPRLLKLNPQSAVGLKKKTVQVSSTGLVQLQMQLMNWTDVKMLKEKPFTKQKNSFSLRDKGNGNLSLNV